MTPTAGAWSELGRGSDRRSDLDEIIAVDWGNRDLVALAQLLDRSITANARTDPPT